MNKQHFLASRVHTHMQGTVIESWLHSPHSRKQRDYCRRPLITLCEVLAGTLLEQSEAPLDRAFIQSRWQTALATTAPIANFFHSSEGCPACVLQLRCLW